jgi:hypothetical protein
MLTLPNSNDNQQLRTSIGLLPATQLRSCIYHLPASRASVPGFLARLQAVHSLMHLASCCGILREDCA